MKKASALILLAFFTLTLSALTFQENEEATSKKLRWAIIFGNIEEVKELITAGADVNRKFNFGATHDITPLYVLCAMGSGNHAEIGKLLIDAGANINEKFLGTNLLHITAMKVGNKSITKFLIENGLDVNEQIAPPSSSEFRGLTPLHLAAGKGKIEVAEVLLENGAEMNLKASNLGYTPLHLAAINGQQTVAEFLVDKGAEVNPKSKTGATPLDLSVDKGHKELADFLRKHGGITGKKWEMSQIII